MLVSDFRVLNPILLKVWPWVPVWWVWTWRKPRLRVFSTPGCRIFSSGLRILPSWCRISIRSLLHNQP